MRFHCETVRKGGVLQLRMRGILDGSSAWEVRHLLDSEEADEVVLDMQGLVEVWDFGAAVLAAGLRKLEVGRLRILHAAPELEDWLDRFAVVVEISAGAEFGMRSGHLRV